MVGAEDEDAGKLSTIPRSVAGAGGEAAAWELAVLVSVPQFPFCSAPFLSWECAVLRGSAPVPHGCDHRVDDQHKAG